MTEAAPTLILYPVFAMFLLVAIVLWRMRSMRFAAVRTNEVSAEYYRTYQDGAEPEALRVVSRNFSNLFATGCAISFARSTACNVWVR